MGKLQSGPVEFISGAAGTIGLGFNRSLRCGGSYLDLFAGSLLTLNPRKPAGMPKRP